MSNLSFVELAAVGEIGSKLAAQIPCKMCRIKGGDNILASGGCRHMLNITASEVVERLSYATVMQDKARAIVSALQNGEVMPTGPNLIKALAAYGKAERT